MQVNNRSKTMPPSGRLLRVLGVGFGLAVIIGNTIGAGILRAPGDVAAHLQLPWLFIGVWIVGGIYALLGAFSLAELGAMLPRAGGQYAFAHHALGPYAGFIVGWSDWLSTCGTTAAVSIVIAEYLGRLIPQLASHTLAIGAFVPVCFGLIQWRGVRWGSHVQNLTSLVKALAFIALVGACFALGGKAPASASSASPVQPSSSMLLGFVIALQAVIYTYDGWDAVIYFSEEVRDPGRDIPRAMISGVLAIILIYLLVNLALVYVLPVDQIANQDLAVGAAAQAILGQRGDTLIRALAVISMLSGINAYQLMATRTLYAMSRDDLFSHSAARVNEGGTPAIALMVSTVIAVAFILSGKFEQVVAMLTFFFVANYTLSFTSVFVLRRREPERSRPYRAWGYPWTTALALIGSVAFLAGAIRSDTRNSIYALCLLAVSYPAYVLLRRVSN